MAEAVCTPKLGHGRVQSKEISEKEKNVNYLQFQVYKTQCPAAEKGRASVFISKFRQNSAYALVTRQAENLNSGIFP